MDITRRKSGFLYKLLKNYTMFLVLIVLVITASFLTDVFLTKVNITNLFRQVAVTGIVSIGVTCVIVGGTFDMSVGSLVSLAGVVCIIIQPKVGVVPSMLIGLAIGIVVGIVNGSVISLIKGNSGDSFMITFGMLTLIQSIALIITKGYPFEGSKSAFYNFFGKGMVGPVPFPILLFAFFAILTHVLLAHTKSGKRIYYMGTNPEVARLTGINITQYRILCYAIAGFMAAFAAIALTGRINGASAKMGLNYEFDAITAVVVGGVSLSGGRGNILNMIIGIFIMGILGNMLNLMGVEAQSQYVVKGIVLIIAVAIDVIRSRKIN
jgi:ribose/xylose/arabinose/galactoside ABC-type transport system permease subunit